MQTDMVCLKLAEKVVGAGSCQLLSAHIYIYDGDEEFAFKYLHTVEIKHFRLCVCVFVSKSTISHMPS